MLNKRRRVLAALTLIATGCAINSDGSISAGLRGSPNWIRTAPRADIEEHFDRIPASELCRLLYLESGTRSRTRRDEVRAEVEATLARRKLYCPIGGINEPPQPIPGADASR